VTCAGLILAAGESSRMGFPKALLTYQNETFLERLVRLLAARCAPVIVVLGHRAEELRTHVPQPAVCVVNPDYRTGQTGSLQCGLRVVPPSAEGVLFTLVDHPAVQAGTLDALLNGQPGALLRVPRYRARRGHPVWFSRRLLPEFSALPPDGAARDVVHAHAAETEFLDVDDAGVVADIDDPEAYRALTGERA
jgi:molybdenum cofactor cytidylyltransferase